eukprot:96101-Rhodomonas_salina.1
MSLLGIAYHWPRQIAEFSTGRPPTDSHPFSGCDTTTTQWSLSGRANTQHAPIPGTRARPNQYQRTIPGSRARPN